MWSRAVSRCHKVRIESVRHGELYLTHSSMPGGAILDTQLYLTHSTIAVHAYSTRALIPSTASPLPFNACLRPFSAFSAHNLAQKQEFKWDCEKEERVKEVAAAKMLAPTLVAGPQLWL